MTYRPASRPLLAALVLAVGLAGCDASSDPGTAGPAAADTEDAALVVARALALDGGGVLEDAAAAVSVVGRSAATRPPDGRPPFPTRPGCQPTRTFDAATLVYTLTSDCTRANGRFSASFARVATVRFLGADGQPQAERSGAAGLDFDILSGTASLVTPRASHRVTALAADLTVTTLDQDLATVNGTTTRATADSLGGPRGSRTVVARLALTLADVRGPRGVEEDWHRAVSGTISGTYTAAVTTTRADGTATTREVSRDIAITLPRGGSDTAEIALGGQRFHADRRTGTVREIAD